MYIRTDRMEGEIRITGYDITPTLDLVITLISPVKEEPDFVRFSLPELGAIVLKLIFHFSKVS